MMNGSTANPRPQPIAIAGHSLAASEIMRAVDIRPGLSMSILDIDSQDDISFRFRKEKPWVGFGFVLAGEMRVELQSPAARLELVHKTGLGGIQFLPDDIKHR